MAQIYEVGAAPSNIFYVLNNADIEFNDAFDSKGEKHPITHGTFVSALESSDRMLRKTAFDSIYDAIISKKTLLRLFILHLLKKIYLTQEQENIHHPLSCTFCQ